MNPDTRARRIRLVVGGACLLILIGLYIPLTRYPDAWPDSQLYASIARSRQLFGDGVPSVQRHSPAATDHLRFYGPVFFDLAAASFDMFGVSRWSFRLVSFVGALVLALAGAGLARILSGSWDRALWAFALLILTPELNLHARSGSMDTVAISIELLALAVFVRGLTARRLPLLHGGAAGLLLAAAALTTPRTYPFIGAFFLAAALMLCRPARWQGLAAQTGAAALSAFAVFAAWATSTHGSLIEWGRMIAYIATHEETDVAVLANATREWSFGPSVIITPAATVCGALWIAWRWRKMDEGAQGIERNALAFALITGWVTLVATVCLMNLTMTVSTYFALPLFGAVIAAPLACFVPTRGGARSPLLLCAIAALLVCDAGVMAKRSLSAAAYWSVRDASTIVAWIRAHVPPGSDIVGPQTRYFFAAERAGAHYRVVTRASWADWTRWMPDVDPEAVGARPRVRPLRGRFLIWPTHEELPPRYGCAGAHPIATYEPVPSELLELVGPLDGIDNPGYPETTLYRLPAGCPSGYDPTGADLAVEPSS